MDLGERLVQPFTKAKYLSADNYKKYTTIINYLYVQHEDYFSPPVLPSDILESIQNNDYLNIFENYDMAKLEADLNQLEEWGNLISHPDTGHVTRIEDFNKRKLRYQCAPETIEIERMMQKLSNQIDLVKGKLDARDVHSLAGRILELEKYRDASFRTSEEREELNSLWQNIFVKFDELRKDSSDYLGVINGRNLDEAMQNKDVKVFQSKFSDYLTSFIIALQQNMHTIEFTLKSIDKGCIKQLVQVLITYQKDRPSLDEIGDSEFERLYTNQWESLKKWFVYDDYNERYLDYLLKQTNETISRFTKYLQQLSERDRLIQNRRKDLEHIAKLYKSEEDFGLCQKCFGAMTNVERPLHFFSLKERKVRSELPIYENKIEAVILKNPREAGVREKKRLVATEISEEQQKEIVLLKLQKKRQDAAILAFIHQGRVELKVLENVESFIRSQILEWISACLNKGEMQGKTEHGYVYRIQKNSEETIQLACVDGILDMPDYVIEFEVSS